GATGATGASGGIGANGATGVSGLNGANGLNGASGDTGATGPVGPAGPQGATGALGTQGPRGDTGVTGATGPQGAAGTGSGGTSFYMRFAHVSVPASGARRAFAVARCDSGDSVVGGGYSGSGIITESSTADSTLPAMPGWSASFFNNTALDSTGFVTAICAH